MMKKILIAFGVLLVLVIGALLAIPQFVSLDKLRPDIVKAINAEVGGEVSIEKLHFRLFPSMRFRMEGLKASQPGYKPATWLELDSLDADIALWSILIQPKAKLVIKNPKLAVLRGDAGTFNFEDFLAKKGKGGAATPPAETTAGAGAEAAANTAPVDVKAVLDTLPGWLKGIVYKARFALVVEGGSVSLADPTLLGKDDRVSLSNIALRLKNIGLDTPMAIDSNVNFDVAFSGVTLKGPFEGDGTVQIIPVDKGMKLKIDLDESLDKTDLRFSNLFRKSAGRALGAKITGEVTTRDAALNLDLSNLELRLDKTRLGGTVKLRNVSAASMGDLDLKMEAKDVDLGGFGVLVPMVADYKLEGKTDLSLSALGSPLDPALLVKIDLRNVGGATPELQRPLKNLNGRIQVAGTTKNPTVTVGPLAMGLGSSDIGFNLSSKGLNPAIVDIKVDSKLIHADELLGLEALKLDAKPKKGDPAPAPAPAKGAKPAPLDESLAAMAPTIEEALKNPALDMAQVTFGGSIGRLVLLGANFDKIQSSLSYKGRNLRIDNAQLSAYGGQLLANVQLGLKPGAFSYSINSGLDAVNFEEILTAHMPSWKNVLAGAMTGTFAVNGVGLLPADLQKNLRGGITGKIVNGSFDLPMLKVVETLAESMPKMSKTAKSAGVDLKKSVGSSRAKGAFRTMDLDAKIVGRQVQLDKLDIEYDPKSIGGQLNFKAKGKVDFDQKIALVGTLFVDPKLIKLEEGKALIGKSGLAELPMKIGGTIAEPQPDYTYTLEFVAKKVLTDKAMGVAADQITKAVGKDAAGAIGEVLGNPKKALKDKKTQKKLGKTLKKLFK